MFEQATPCRVRGAAFARPLPKAASLENHCSVMLYRIIILPRSQTVINHWVYCALSYLKFHESSVLSLRIVKVKCLD